jgi:hypothetical protein
MSRPTTKHTQSNAKGTHRQPQAHPGKPSHSKQTTPTSPTSGGGFVRGRVRGCV